MDVQSWDCPNCGTLQIIGGLEKCPVCGTSRDVATEPAGAPETGTADAAAESDGPPTDSESASSSPRKATSRKASNSG